MESKAWNRAKRHMGTDLSPDELTPTEEHLVGVIAQLAEENEQLKDELRRVKGETTRPEIKASRLNEPSPDGKRVEKKGQSKGKGKRKKRPGSAKRSKTSTIEIDVTVPLHPENLPPGSHLVDYHDVVVQDLEIRRRNVKYRRARYRLPDGGFMTAALPSGVEGHFGADLRRHVLYPYYQNHVTQPLIYEELREPGVDISVGQVNRLVTEGHDVFHEEKDDLLPELNEALLVIHSKREHLLLVLDRPEIPLHNNLSENDIREYVKKRHISAGTRSDLGRRCRDTFLSLKKTCRKLGISFWAYLRDRIGKLHEIPPLADLIRAAAEAT